MNICCSLVFLVIVQGAYCGVVEKNEETRKEVEVIADTEADKIECDLKPQDNIADGKETANSPLLYDTNVDHHPSIDGNSDGVKHKRCHHSYGRVGASLEPRFGIVGAKTPLVVERRDLQRNFYEKACATCLGRCTDMSDCPVCEKWCSKAADTDEPNEVNTNVVEAQQEMTTPEEPVMLVRSNFDDEKQRNVYTLAILRTGSKKELIMKMLGVNNLDDIDTAVIWVTTHSNDAPSIYSDFDEEVNLEVEKAAEALKRELNSKLQKFHNNGMKFVKDGKEGMDNVIQNILSEAHPTIPDSKGVDNSKMDSLRSSMASRMLPRYPIESEPLIVPQSMNPGIIEGPPNFRTTDGESEDPDNLEATHDQVGEHSVAQLTDRTLSLPHPNAGRSLVGDDSIAQWTDRTVTLPKPNSGGSRVGGDSIAQLTDRTLSLPHPNSGGSQLGEDSIAQWTDRTVSLPKPISGGSRLGEDSVAQWTDRTVSLPKPKSGGSQLGEDSIAQLTDRTVSLPKPKSGESQLGEDSIAQWTDRTVSLPKPKSGGSQLGEDSIAQWTDRTVSLPKPKSGGSRPGEDSIAQWTDRTVSLPKPKSGGSRLGEDSIAQWTDRTVSLPKPKPGESRLGEDSIAQWTDRTVSLPNPNSGGSQVSEQKKTQPPDFVLRAENQPEFGNLPLYSLPRPFAANQEQELTFRRFGNNEDTGGYNLGTPLENSFNEKFATLKKNSGMDRFKEQMAPGARLREFIDNVKANIVSSKNALPLNTLGATHHNARKGHGNREHPHNHRSSSQDDNIGMIYKQKEKIVTTTEAPDPGPLIEKLPLPPKTPYVPTLYTGIGGMYVPIRHRPSSKRFSEQSKNETIVSKSDTQTELERNADSDNHEAKSITTTETPDPGPPKRKVTQWDYITHLPSYSGIPEYGYPKYFQSLSDQSKDEAIVSKTDTQTELDRNADSDNHDAKSISTTETPDPGPPKRKVTQWDYPMPSYQGIPEYGYPKYFQSLSDQSKDEAIVSKTDTQTELERNADSDNHNARSSKTTDGYSKGHGKGHGKGHNQWHGKGHGQWNHPGQMHGHGHPGPLHGHGQGHGYRSSEPGSPDILNMAEKRTVEWNPENEYEMLAEPAIGDQFDLKNNPVRTRERPAVPVKFNVGARANELIQKLKERQEMRKASSTLQSSPSGASHLGGSAGSVEGVVEPFAHSGKEASWAIGAKGPFQNQEINNFENAEAALGVVSDISENLQKITDTGNIKTDDITSYAEQSPDTTKKLNVGMNTPEILGSQPLENSLERMQPSKSLSGRPWRKQNFGKALINEPKNEIVDEPSLGSTNPEGDLENQNLNGFAGSEMVAETNPDMNTRGQFEGEQNSFSSSMGAIVPLPNMEGHKKPSDVFFLGNGIKLPLKMVKGGDGVLHLSVDLDKLCSCNNITCPKNHTVLEKAVETILENEADELKEQLEPMALVGKGIDPSHMQDDFGDMPLGMASPQVLFEDGTSDLEQRLKMQPRMGAFEDDAMGDGKEEQMAQPHRNQRDTDEESRFFDKTNKIDDFHSMELQRDNSEVLKSSPEVKAEKSGPKSLHDPMKKFVVTATHTPHRSGDVQSQQNLLLKNTKLNDGAHVSRQAKAEDTKTTLLSESTSETGESATKTSSSDPNNLQHFMNKKLDDIRSKLEIRNGDMKKELSFPEYFFKNLWATGQEQAEKIASNLNTNLSPMLGSRLGSLFGKTAAANNELYENLAPITKPYKFKALENQLKSNMEHIGDTVDNYTKRDEEILKEEVAAMDKMTKNPVVKKEVGIVSNILKFFKDLAADKNKRK